MPQNAGGTPGAGGVGTPGGQPREGGGSGSDGGAETTVIGEDTPLTTEDLDWRSRALKAEEEVKTLTAQLTQSSTALSEATTRINAIERTASIERSLRASRPRSFDTVVPLITQLLDADGSLIVEDAIASLVRERPELFIGAATQDGPRIGTMSGTIEETGQLASLATQARESGNRNLLLKYLRARRKG
jgi:hypothetical protein